MLDEVWLINSITVSRSHLVPCSDVHRADLRRSQSVLHTNASRCQTTMFVRSDLKLCGGFESGRCLVRHVASLQHWIFWPFFIPELRRSNTHLACRAANLELSACTASKNCGDNTSAPPAARTGGSGKESGFEKPTVGRRVPIYCHFKAKFLERLFSRKLQAETWVNWFVWEPECCKEQRTPV